MTKKKFVPMNDEPEEVINRVYELERELIKLKERVASQEDLCLIPCSNLTQLTETVDKMEYMVDGLDDKVEKLTLENDVKTDQKQYCILTLRIDTKCKRCGSKRIIIDGTHESISYLCKCDECGNTYEIPVIH